MTSVDEISRDPRIKQLQTHSIPVTGPSKAFHFFFLQSLSIDTYAQLSTARPEIATREFAHYVVKIIASFLTCLMENNVETSDSMLTSSILIV
jgi:hypothetical protein